MQNLKHYHENPCNYGSSLSVNATLSCIPKTFANYFYIKDQDQLGLPEKEGYYEKRTENGTEIYTGKFVLNSEHGNCICRWITDQGTTVYEGYIYCNLIDGYGRFSYPSGSIYEGLFRNNRRYGPGVHTESNGKQNVGFWNNQKLLKLSVKLNSGVPTWSNTAQGRAKALKFKRLLKVEQKCTDKAKDILIEMNAPQHILDVSNSLYNVQMRDPRSETFFWEPYEEIFLEKLRLVELQKIMQTILKADKGNKLLKYKKKGKNKWKDFIDEIDNKKEENAVLFMNTTHLISWNNSPVMEEMILFCFRHILQEAVITYNIPYIIKGKRENFRAPGLHEILCVRFLKKCQIGDESRVHDYLAFKNIDPNVSDSQGNTGLLIAAANDKLAVIDVILDHGADINLCNDDGFTPLGLCVTKYVALINKFKDWGKAFLSNIEEIKYPANILKWRHPGQQQQSYKRIGDDTSVTDTLQSAEDSEPIMKEKEEYSSLGDPQTEVKIASVKETIRKLIERGADPLKSDVPMHILIMAVKCRDEYIIQSLLQTQSLLEAKEQENLFLEDALFTAIQLPADDAMVSICTKLLQFGANPNAGTECTQEDENMFKICHLSEDERGIKTVLHKLVTRQDGSLFSEHLCAAVKLLLTFGANPDALFLGHTPLSAAIFKGNFGMIQCLMTLKINPNQKLAKELGVPLTVLMTTQCIQKLSSTDAISIADVLVKNGANLLADTQVGDFIGNVIEFSDKELDNYKHQSKGGKQSKTGSYQSYKVILDYIIKLAEQDLINKVKEIVTKSSQLSASFVTRFIQTGRLSNKSKIATKRKEEMMPPILPELPSWINACDIEQIINNIQECEKSLAPKDHVSVDLKPVKLQKKSLKNSADKVLKQVNKKPWSLMAALKRPRLITGSENFKGNENFNSSKEDKKSDICFGCGRKFNEDNLRLCPVCRQAKFCSAECFWKAWKDNTHKCTGDIFPDWKDDPGYDSDQHDKYQGPNNPNINPGKRERKVNRSRNSEKKKKGSTSKTRMKKQQEKEDDRIQNIPNEGCEKAEIDEKIKSNKVHEHLEIFNTTKKQPTKESFIRESAVNESPYKDIKRDSDNKITIYKTEKTGEGYLVQIIKDKVTSVIILNIFIRRGKNSITNTIKDSMNRQHQGDVVRRENVDRTEEEYVDFSITSEPILNQCLKGLSTDTRLTAHYTFKDGNLYYIYDSNNNKKQHKSLGQENYAFN